MLECEAHARVFIPGLPGDCSRNTLETESKHVRAGACSVRREGNELGFHEEVLGFLRALAGEMELLIKH